MLKFGLRNLKMSVEIDVELIIAKIVKKGGKVIYD